MKKILRGLLFAPVLTLSGAVSDGQIYIQAGPDFTRLEYYHFNPASPLADRIDKVPAGRS
jgi:hypothetical protein